MDRRQVQELLVGDKFRYNDQGFPSYWEFKEREKDKYWCYPLNPDLTRRKRADNRGRSEDGAMYFSDSAYIHFLGDDNDLYPL